MSTEKNAPKGSVPCQEADRLKELGFVQNKGTNRFNCRVVTRSGRLNAPELKEVIRMAEEYGEGEIIFVGDGTIEIKGILYENVDQVLKQCKEHGISTGGTGAKVRPIVPCAGKECAYSIFDAYALAEKLRELFYVRLHDVELPGKMEIAVSACPQNCADVDLYDIGIIGIKVPQCDQVNCMGCKNCAVVKRCPQAAAQVVDRRIKIHSKKCIKCGLCVGICPFGTITKGTMAYRVYIGGSRGQKKREGRSFDRLFTMEEAVLSVVDRLIGVYQDEGRAGEAFYETVGRIGFETVEKKVIVVK